MAIEQDPYIIISWSKWRHYCPSDRESRYRQSIYPKYMPRLLGHDYIPITWQDMKVILFSN